MRVLHLTRDFPPTSAGGISTGVGWLARSMRAEGWPQAVASFDGWRPRKQNDRVEDRGDVLRIQGRPFGALRAFAERFGPDLCVVHDPLIDRAVGPLPGRRLFFVHVDHRRLRELRGLEEPTTSERAMERAMAEADAVLAPSQALVDRLARRGQGARRARLGVDPPPTGPVPQGDDVLHLGRLDRAKGTDLLLSALDGLPAPLLAGGLSCLAALAELERRRAALPAAHLQKALLLARGLLEARPQERRHGRPRPAPLLQGPG